MENSNTKIKDFLFSWLTSCSNKASGKITSFGFVVIDVIVGDEYSITLNDVKYSYTAISGDSSIEVLNELKTLIDDTNYFETIIEADKLLISLNSLDYFTVDSSSNVNPSNENGVVVLEAFNNTGLEINDILSNMKPEEFPFVTFKISTHTVVAEDITWSSEADSYTVHKKVLVDLNFYNPVDYMNLAEYVMAGLKFESTELKRKSLYIGVVGPSSPILNVSEILGGKSEGRANTTLTLSVATTFYDTGISEIINIDPIENVTIDATEVSDKETHTNTIIIQKEL